MSCYEVALAGLWMKADCLGLIPSAGEDEVEFAMSYGHLHAHTIEEHWGGQVAHALCVFIGLLIDLRLGGARALAESLAYQATKSVLSRRFAELLRQDRVRAYVENYPSSGRFYAGPGKYWTIDFAAKGLGQLVSADRMDIVRKEVRLEDIESSYRALSVLFDASQGISQPH